MSNALILDRVVPISRFNKGEATKIFSEVKETGTKYVFKNNLPECVLLSPEMYDQMVENLIDMELYIEALERVNRADRKIFTAEEAEEMLDRKSVV